MTQFNCTECRISSSGCSDDMFVVWLLLGAGRAQERKRDFVLALWRHGARSPMEFDPFVGDDLALWPDGTGQLTQFGVELHQGMNKFNSFTSFSWDLVQA